MNLGTLLVHCMFQHLRRDGERERGGREGGREEGWEGERERGRERREEGRERELRTTVTITHSLLPVYLYS